MNFPKDFLLGAATAAHQVEGNNTNSDFWAMEQLPHTIFAEPSRDAVDHYNRYEEDILLLKNAGLNAYRFSVEWARVEPEQGRFDEAELAHYRAMLRFCRDNGVEPVVTMHHFSSPKWLIERGGWEVESTVSYFAAYCRRAAEEMGDLMNYVCTINEANMGAQIAKLMNNRKKPKEGEVQVGVNAGFMEERMRFYMMETAQTFGIADPTKVAVFLTYRTRESEALVMRAHEAAREAMKAVCPHLKIGITFSLHDYQLANDSPEAQARLEAEWEEEFGFYLPYIKNDDFFGVQNYTRKLVGREGVLPAPEDVEVTQMNYEFYPEGVGNVIRAVAKDLCIPLMVTENGVATSDDSRRAEFIRRALAGVRACMDDGIPVLGYMHWSLLDNFEWMLGYCQTFGLVAVDRATQARHPKPSLAYLGAQR